MINIVVDSASDVDSDEAKNYGVTLLPMEVRFGNELYMDGVDLSHRRFFEKLIESDELPKTSQINEYRFEECFQKLTEGGDEVIALTLSSELSGTYDSAVKAAAKFDGKVFVIDSLNATIGERILLEYCIRLVKAGMSASEIYKECNRRKGDIKLLALVGTLKYLQKGGRISKTTAIAGELLNVKPVIAVEKGEVKLVGKAMGSKKANNLLVKMIENSGGIDFDMPYAVAYSGLDRSTLDKYMEDSRDIFAEKTEYVPIYMVGSTIGTHVGPGAVAVAFFAKEKK